MDAAMETLSGRGIEDLTGWIEKLEFLYPALSMMALPLGYAILTVLIQAFHPLLNKLIEVAGLKPYEVEITHMRRLRNGLYEVKDLDAPKNKLLQKAVMMYIGKKCRSLWPTSKTLLLAASEESGKGDPYDSDEEVFGSTADSLDRYSVISLPVDGDWAEIEPQLWYCYYETPVQNEGDDKKQTVGDEATISSTELTMELSSTRRTGKEEHIKEFLNKALEWYTKELEKCKPSGRYMYQAFIPEQDDNAARMYQKFQLSDTKTFDNLFIPNKAPLLRLVDNFLNKRDKFAKEGFPDKLGLLLYGPPGTGKTSFIKCLAHYTKRHIVSINLAKIETNRELMEVMYDLEYNVIHEDDPVTLDFKDVIFVMEDVDCASEVVKSRSPQDVVARSTEQEDLGRDMTLTHTMTYDSYDDEELGTEERGGEEEGEENPGEGGDGEEEEEDMVPASLKEEFEDIGGWEHFVDVVAGGDASLLKNLYEEDLRRLVDEFWKKSTTASKSRPVKKARVCKELLEWASAEDEDEGNDEDQNAKSKGKSKDDDSDSDSENAMERHKNIEDQKKDKLSLAGLLNALDGVVDTPGRIVVLTTNVRQQLDPALIRPGRVNQRIELGYMQATEAAQMFEYYFDEKDVLHRPEMTSIFRNNRFTPAELEQLCAENNTLDDLFATMKLLLTLHPRRPRCPKRHRKAH